MEQPRDRPAGKLPDTQIAERLGIHRRYVMLKRRELGIANPTVAQNESRWTPEIVKLIGRVPDSEIAARLKCDPGTVAEYRYRHDIELTARQRAPRVKWTPSMLKRLGTKPDQQLATELGLSPQAVTYRRNKEGIPQYRSGTRTRRRSNTSRSH